MTVSDIIAERLQRLDYLQNNPDALPGLMAHYRHAPWDFISDWGVTFDPRNVEDNLPATVPFVLFPKQREWMEWTVERWRRRENGLTEKTRDMGMSWCSVALAATLCLTHSGLAIGFGSRKENYVDKIGDPKSLFWKARFFLDNLPPMFLGGWRRDRHAPHMRIQFPGTNSVMTGEAGDGIGRGDRASLYFVDEAAFLERPHLVEASLSATTNCRIDVSTPNGTANPFYAKRVRYPRERVFTFHWRDDPRKDDAWYAKQVEELDAVTVAQEIDINYAASVEGVLIPQEWVQAAINADKKLGLTIRGPRRAALDVADEGKDLNALCIAEGVKIKAVPSWSGKGSDILGTVNKAFALCDEWDVDDMRFDSDGLGAGVRGDARALNEARAKKLRIRVTPWRGSGAVVKPDRPIPTANKGGGQRVRTNGDYFKNAKAQGWWGLRVRFQRTFRAVTEGVGYDPADLIVLAEGLGSLYMELSQPTYLTDNAGRIMVEKAPEGAASPNEADSVMIRMADEQGGGYDLAAAL